MIFGKISPKIRFFETLEREREREREKERERERIQVSFGDFLGFIGQNSSGQVLKFIASTRATRRHQKGEISSKIQKEEI